MFARRDATVANYDDGGQVAWLDSAGIDLLRGTARLDGPKRVVVTAIDGTETVVEARAAVAVATGSSALIPPIEGLAEAKPWTSREATSATEAPGRLIVLGGGVVGAEMATAYTSPRLDGHARRARRAAQRAWSRSPASSSPTR